MESLTDEQHRDMNDRYRDQEPSDLHKQAFRDAIQNGAVREEHVVELVDRLYDPFSESSKNLPVDPYEPTVTQDEGNGLGRAVVRNTFSMDLHISKKLWHQQPMGVLLRPINDEVRKAGEALITDVYPRSADVESDVMPCEHVKIRIEPFPLWLEKWVGDDGYNSQ